MKRLPERSRELVLIGALFVGGTLAPAALAAEADQTSNSVVPIEAFQSFSTFAEVARDPQTITFDELETGASVGNPALLGRVEVVHSAATTFKTIGSPFAPVSSPNVLAPFGSDSTLESSGDTTLSFAKNTRLAGVFLVIASGSNEATTWTSSVVVTDVKQNSLAVVLSFQGVVGEQRFIGFKSRHKLDTISFGPAFKADAFTVVALDDIVVD